MRLYNKFIGNKMEPKFILSENDVMGCDSNGRLLDMQGKVTTENPCGFARTYDCMSKTCVYSPWFLFIVGGLPFLAIVVFLIGISVLLRKQNK